MKQHLQVDANELASRKRWTQSTRVAVEKHQASAQGTLDRARARGGDSGAGAGGGSRLDNAISRENDQFISDSTDQQQLLMNKQDVDLDDISASINRIGQVGLTIGEELEQQGKEVQVDNISLTPR